MFDGQVKLIKHDYAGEGTLGTAQHGSATPNSSYYKGSLSSIPYYYWSGSSSNSSNTWSSSTLNTSILNGTYLNTLGSEWSSLIATTIWKVGGMSYIQINTAKQYYTTELGSSSSSTTYSAKVGLMYLSEYGYAASPENWNTTLNNYANNTNRNNNWMHMVAYEWTISRISDDTSGAFFVAGVGVLGLGNVYGDNGVRPSFYLQPWVLYSNGNGTQENPFRVSAPSNLISFTIDGTTYYAEEGMTWSDLSLYYQNIRCTSSYCNYTSGNETSTRILANGVEIVPSDIILENQIYVLGNEHDGGSN